MTKKRVALDVNLAAEVLFRSDSTCCVCRERGKTTQIHHIDEDPSNGTFYNLAVLCLECHNNTQLSGGFGRKMTAPVVNKYRDEWISRVNSRRTQADEIAVAKMANISDSRVADKPLDVAETKDPLLSYVNSLPELRAELLQKAEPEWDSGVTARMVQASYDYIDGLQGILVRLASYYPEGHFGALPPTEFLSHLISSRFQWHRAHTEPHGPGTGGTIVHVMVSRNVITDVETMVKDIVMSLVGYDDSFDWRGWPVRWKGRKVKHIG